MLVWPFILVLKVSGVVERIERVDLGPGGQTPYLRRVRGSILQVKVIWMYSIGKMSERREKARGSFCILQVQGSRSVKEQPGFWWFGESDDQYGACDLRTSGLEAASRAKQGFDGDGLGSFGRVGAKMFVGLQSGRERWRLSAASEGREEEGWLLGAGVEGGCGVWKRWGNLVWSLIFLVGFKSKSK